MKPPQNLLWASGDLFLIPQINLMLGKGEGWREATQSTFFPFTVLDKSGLSLTPSLVKKDGYTG